MEQDPVVSLIKDLSAKLSAVAEDFSGRVSQVTAAPRDAVDPIVVARRLIGERRIRRSHLPDELFHEPAWDMLLALYLADRERRVMNVKTLVATADAPVTTSQRWIEHLAKLGLVTRVVDPADRRRIEVSLSATGFDSVEAYLKAIA